jgi:sugar transferase (PEP-CTERM/EpsH1 system associated)
MTEPENRPRVLFLSTRFPFPLDTGGKIRTANILRQLHKRFRLTVVSYVEADKDLAYLPQIEAACERFVQVPWTEPRKYTLAYYWKILKRSFSRQPVTVLNDATTALRETLRRELEEVDYDLVLCDFVQAALNIPEPWRVPVIIFQHNVEAAILERHAETAASPTMRWFWRSQFLKMRAFEGAMCRKAQGIIAVSEVDKRQMEERYGVQNVEPIPTGVDTAYFQPTPEVDERRQLVFVGSMDWEPNDDAMHFFLGSAHDRIRARFPDLELVIVGRNPSPRLQALAERSPGVRLTGRVEDTRPYIAESAVFIVPIRIGGGTRIKIYEALAMGKAVVSTTVGAEGLPLEDGKHILLADDAGAFALRVIELLEDAERRRELGRAGRDYVVRDFGWEKVGEVFASICRKAIQGRLQAIQTK